MPEGSAHAYGGHPAGTCNGKDGHPDRVGAQKQGEELAAFIGKEYADIFGETMKNAVVPVRKDGSTGVETDAEQETIAPKPEIPVVTPTDDRLVLNFDTSDSFKTYMQNGDTGFILPNDKKMKGEAD